MNDRLSFRRQTTQHLRRARPEIKRTYLGAMQPAALPVDTQHVTANLMP